LVWDTATEPLLICNALALQTGLIDFVAPNATRTSQYGQAAFSTDWRELITHADTVAASTYHEDVMPEDVDDIIDLSAPLRCGDQDISTLPADALAYARKYPWMTKAIPRDAHAGLDKWTAHVREEAIPLYSWPKVALKDLKEDKIPFPVVPQLHREFDKLIAMHYAEEVTECPTAVAMRAQLVSKNKKETRFCVNGSTQKNVLAVASFPMPHIRQIFSFVSSFPYRAKLDLKHGYHNFDIDPASRKWTVTIGAGRAIQWRKLVQGFAPSGAFFQHAMVKLLGPAIVWVIAAVYLDDIIVVGKNKKECAANVDTVMSTLAHYRFRINFAKCQFTPSTNIDFLGCSLRGSMVHPGPKVPLMLAKILPPHVQRTPKAQRHHLHVFLGMCAFVLQHCPGLKTVLAPLYVAVASDPFTYGHAERDAFERALGMLANLQPYFLPSCDPGVTIELMTDASGGEGTPSDPGSWAAVLGQRKGQFNVDSLTDNFELVQTEGGVFNNRQASWDILKKEGFALFQALHRFKQFIWGRHIRIITDSKVLMFMFRSDNAVIKRWHAFIQTFDYSMIHVNSDANSIADCLTRCLSVPPPVQDRTPRLLSTASHVPAPSLLKDGDVEPNPGPFTDELVTVILSSSDDDHPPLAAPIIIDSSSNAASPESGTSRLRQPHRSRSSRSQLAAPAPEPSALVTSPRSALSNVPAHQLLDRPEQHLAQASSTVFLKPIQVAQGPDSFCASFSAAMQDDTNCDANIAQLSIPFRPLDIRERTMWFLSEHSDTPMSLFHGLSFSQVFRQRPPVLSFSHRPDSRTAATFQEYATLAASPTTYPDPIFIAAAATTYHCQLVIFLEDGSVTLISPSTAFRRVFLFCTDDQTHYNWGSVLTADQAASSAPEDEVRPYAFDAPPLRPDRRRTSRTQSLSSSLDIHPDKLSAIHAAHCGYTGHPGVAATVKTLIAGGHKWRRMTAQVAQFIKRCPTCCSSRLRLQHAPVSASTLRLHARPLRRWHIDQTGAMSPCHYTGYTRLMVFVCEATQFCALYGSRHGTALEVAVALIHLMGWTDLAESLHSDNGAEYDNYVIHQLQQITGLKHSFSIPYNPSTNGIAERNISLAKRFVRSLTVDMSMHNAWGLLLPLAQKGINDLRRENLAWHSPNEIVFASLHDHTSTVIPTFYSSPLREADRADANHYPISANFAHRVMCFQQMLVNSFHDLLDRSFDAASRRDPTAFSDLVIGQSVLIDWPDCHAPSPVHPMKQGPYRVVEVRRNHVTLQHWSNPPLQDQDYIVHWSKHANIYRYIEDDAPHRSPLDASASQVPLGPPSRRIDCVLQHSLKPDAPNSPEDKRHVANQIYQCRLYGTDLSASAHANTLIRSFTYDEIAHTFAFDSYVQSHRQLVGHSPVTHMPANWNPHATPPQHRPSHPPLPLHEQLFPLNDADSEFSQ
jgi:transposase InsO family protein